MELFALMGKIAVNGKDANKEIDSVTGHAQNAEGKISSAFSKIGKAVAGAFTVAAVAGFEKKIVSTYATYDDQMRKVQAVSGATGKQFEMLRGKAEELGAKTRFSATEAGQGMENLARAGWKTGEIMSGIGPVLSFATANAIDLGSAAGIVSDGLSQFGLKAKDTGMFTDVLSATAASANTDISLLGETFKYCGGPAGALGYKLKDVAVAIGLMANKGIKGSQAGTTLRSAMTRLANPTGKSAKAMKKLGISITDSSGKVKPFAILMQELRGKFSKLNEAQKAQMASTIFGQEAMSGMLAVVNSSDEDFNKMTKAISNCDGQTQKMADTMDGGLGGAIAGVKSAFEGLLIKLGGMQEGILVDGFRKLAEVLQNLPSKIQSASNKINSFKNFLKDNETTIKSVTIALGVLGIGIGVYSGKLTVATLATKAISAAQTIYIAGLYAAEFATKAFGAAIGFITSPIGIVTIAVAAFAAAAYLIYKNWDKIGPWLSNLWNGIKEVSENVWNGLKDFFSTTWQAIVDIFITIWEGIKWPFEMLWEIIKAIVLSAMSILEAVIGTGLNVIKAIWELIWNNIKDFVLPVWNAIKTTIQTVINAIKNIVTTVWNAIKSVTTTVWNSIKGVIITVWSGIKSVVTSAINVVKSVITTVWNAIKSVTSSVWNGIKGVISGVWNGIKSVVTGAVNGVKSVVTGVWNTIKSVTSSVWNGIKDTIQKPIQAAADFVGKQVERIKGFFSRLSIKFPHIKLPHFKLDGEFSLMPPKVPHIGVDWYAEGGILTKPTVFGMMNGRPQVGGEAGPEAVLPIEKLSDILIDTFKNMGMEKPIIIQLDGRTIARVTAPYMSEELSFRNKRRF
ncbi:phage tail tape measure protein [Clostridium haemolyticum]|uniref:Tail tape measure protein n=1 Tax=Clostridium haemolyticum NCTC 9693 TaxID=1443114 RepID=A0ABR4TCF0_CLOHA|nr:phage tail tape measure protein [Clostridium haemolyticum]KEI15464.1 tail tape measure protein [Clostridium haemolyticum NCTC 9693]